MQIVVMRSTSSPLSGANGEHQISPSPGHQALAGDSGIALR
jgi:hypothetical protein